MGKKHIWISSLGFTLIELLVVILIIDQSPWPS